MTSQPLQPGEPAAAAGATTPADQAAELIKSAFGNYWQRFRRITRRARSSFESQDWTRIQADARERLDLYPEVVDEVIRALPGVLGPRYRHDETWARIRGRYAEGIIGVPAEEIAETFFNSVTRRVFETVGVNQNIEFVDFEFTHLASGLGDTPVRSYTAADDATELVLQLLTDCQFSPPFANLEMDAAAVAERVCAAWDAGGAPVGFESVEVLKPVFFRRKGAYLVARVRGGHRVMPLVIALGSGRRGITVDATLTDEADVSIVFSFTHSYFHADVDRPSDVIDFLRSIMPAKPVSELYAGLGFHKHGKTELYRHLRRHLKHTDEKFELAPGTPGMVMAVFTMPGFDVVFKVIRDTFPAPKRTTAADVRRRYDLVFQHDRAGRLVDAQEFGHLTFSRHRFTPDLLDELQRTAAANVTVTDEHVAISHLYTERRVRPLNLFLREADEGSRRRILMDYGQAIEDLAATGVFPGDLLIKNFGVTRQGRVIFYDYDELCLLDECVFRTIPPAPTPEAEMAAEPWFHVGAHDIFPEEFPRFLDIPPADRNVFMQHHGQLFRAGFWKELQSRWVRGDLVDIYPYARGTAT